MSIIFRLSFIASCGVLINVWFQIPLNFLNILNIPVFPTSNLNKHSIDIKSYVHYHSLNFYTANTHSRQVIIQLLTNLIDIRIL